MNINVSVMALFLEVPGWDFTFSSKNYDPTFSQLTVQRVCILRHILEVACGCSQLSSVLWWLQGSICQLMATSLWVSHHFTIPSRLLISQKSPLHQGPQRCHSSKWSMLLLVTETDCFLGKWWPTAWVLRYLGEYFSRSFLSQITSN